MTKLDRVIAAAKLVDTANQAIARNRGVLARAHNRPRTGILVPKFDSAEERDAFDAGWVWADDQFPG